MNWLAWVLLGIFVSTLFLIWEKWFTKVTIYEYETGFKYQQGKHVATLSAGSYRLRRGHSEIRKLDLRKQYQTIPGQEILTADRIQIKLSLVLGFSIQDPLKVLHEVDNYQQVLYLRLQLLLREALQHYELDSFLSDQQGLLQQLQTQAKPALAELGLELNELALKDIMLPGDLKRAYAQVLKVQKEAQATLEKARGEQAALRCLANAARMLDKNPSLLNLRLIQSMENAQARPTIIFHASGESASLMDPEEQAKT
jgi:regulator of protease activity HflC (stomatin/prohibitin superfamily)